MTDELEPLRIELLANLKARLPELKAQLADLEGCWGIEDAVYRFYHQSFKVYPEAQGLVEPTVAALQSLLPERELNEDFLEIAREGTGEKWEPEHNQDWLRHTRPIIEALFHCHYFLEMACKYGEKLTELPTAMPSGWAAFLYLYRLR